MSTPALSASQFLSNSINGTSTTAEPPQVYGGRHDYTEQPPQQQTLQMPGTVFESLVGSNSGMFASGSHFNTPTLGALNHHHHNSNALNLSPPRHPNNKKEAAVNQMIHSGTVQHAYNMGADTADLERRHRERLSQGEEIISLLRDVLTAGIVKQTAPRAPRATKVSVDAVEPMDIVVEEAAAAPAAVKKRKAPEPAPAAAEPPAVKKSKPSIAGMSPLDAEESTAAATAAPKLPKTEAQIASALVRSKKEKETRRLKKEAKAAQAVADAEAAGEDAPAPAPKKAPKPVAAAPVRPKPVPKPVSDNESGQSSDDDDNDDMDQDD